MDHQRPRGIWSANLIGMKILDDLIVLAIYGTVIFYIYTAVNVLRLIF